MQYGAPPGDSRLPRELRKNAQSFGTGKTASAMPRVVAQRRQRRRVDRDQAILAELGLPDVQDTVGEVDIGAIEAERFAGPQARAGQQSDQRRHTMARPGVRRNAAAGRHE